MLVLEPIENAGLHKSLPSLLGILGRFELEKDEHVIRVVDVAEDALDDCLLTGLRSILVDIGLQAS